MIEQFLMPRGSSSLWTKCQQVLAIAIFIQRLYEEWGVETFGEQAYFHLIEPLELNGKLRKFYAKAAPKTK